MQISPLNNNIQRQSFGMAKLTTKGEEAARTFVDALPDFLDTRCYHKNLLKPLLKKGSATLETDLVELFQAGNTVYPFNNKLFIKKQISGFGAKGAIAKFLKRETTGTTDGVPTLSTKGQTLIDELLRLFDTNVSNPEVSSAQGKKILNIVSPYVPTDVLIPRSSVVSNKIFSKN